MFSYSLLPYFIYLVYFRFCERDCIENKYGVLLCMPSCAVGREQWNNNALRAVVFRRLSVRAHTQTNALQRRG